VVRGKRFFRMGVKLTGSGISLNGGVELSRLECLEPSAKPRELARGELFNRFLDVLRGGHVADIA
jgi:hypothetical protein